MKRAQWVVHLRWDDEQDAQVTELYRQLIELTDVDLVDLVETEGDEPRAD